MSTSSACAISSAGGRRFLRECRSAIPKPLSRANSRARAGILLLLGAGAVAPCAAQQRLGDDIAIVHDRCVAFARANPKEGLERAQLWKDEGGGFAADHCIAMALFQLADYQGAARRFEALATAMLGLPAPQRALALDQAGQAWLDAREPARAKADFDAALALNGEDAELLIDRAEASAALRQYWDAIDDLNRAIELAPGRADAYIYRGTAYRYLDALDLAMDDIEHGLALAPDASLGLLERGNLRRLKGDLAGARQDWRRVTELAPNTPQAKAAKVNLEANKAGAAAAAKR
jgi:tetratricopeptide (TPR) repeat protein